MAASFAITLGLGTSSAQIVTTPNNFMTACLANAPSVLGQGGPTGETRPGGVTVKAPDTVTPGEEFDVEIAPAAITYPNKQSVASVKSMSRVKLDLALPENATLIRAEVLPGTSSGLSGQMPGVIVVNEQGNPDANGSILRLSGNNETTGNGPSGSTGSRGGIVAIAGSGSNTTFQLPTIKARLKAGGVGDVQMKLRTAGVAGQWNKAENFQTFLAEVDALGTKWAATHCTPRDSATNNATSNSAPLNTGAGALSKTIVREPDVETQTSLAVDPAPQVGQASTLTATVSAGGGTVSFTNNGVAVGGPVAVESGQATAQWTPGPADSGKPYSLVANLTASSGHANSASAAATGTVTAAPDVVTSTALAVNPAPQASVGSSLVATVAGEGGAVVNGGTVSFTNNGAPIGSAAVRNGRAEATWQPATADAGQPYELVASFSADSGYTASQSGPQSGVIAAAPDNMSQTALTVDPAPQAKQPSTLTATVTGGHDGDTVTFTNGGAPVGSALLAGGVAKATWTPGEHEAGQAFELIAHYQGSGGYAASQSPAQTGTVADAAPAVPGAPSGLGVSPANPTVDDVITVRGTAEPGAAVSVRIGGKSYDGVADAQTGEFAVPTAKFSAATHTATVTAANGQGASAPVEVVFAVNPAPRPADPTISIDPLFPRAGETVQVTITVPGGAEGASVSLADGQATVCADAKLDAQGQTTCEWTPAAKGVHTLKVTVGAGVTEFAVNVAEVASSGGGDTGGSGSLAGLGDLGALFGSLGTMTA